MNLLQRYRDFGLIPRNWPDSCRSCCDKGMRLRQSRGIGFERVVNLFFAQKFGGMNLFFYLCT